MKDHGTWTKGTEKAMNDSVTGTNIWETMNMEESVERGFTPGSTETPMMENGLMESSTDMVFGKE